MLILDHKLALQSKTLIFVCQPCLVKHNHQDNATDLGEGPAAIAGFCIHCQNAFESLIPVVVDLEVKRRLQEQIQERFLGKMDPMASHKCRPIARGVSCEDGREIWLGELLEPIPDHPRETHCLHITTPAKRVVLGINAGDMAALAVLAQIVDGLIDNDWLNSMEIVFRKRAVVDCPHCGGKETVTWNSYNGATQCHSCGLLIK